MEDSVFGYFSWTILWTILTCNLQCFQNKNYSIFAVHASTEPSTTWAGFSISAMSLKIVLDQYLLFLADRLSVQSLISSVLKPMPGSLQALLANLSSLRSKAKPSFWCRPLTLNLSHNQHDLLLPSSPTPEPRGLSLHSSLTWDLREGRVLQLSKTLQLLWQDL